MDSVTIRSAARNSVPLAALTVAMVALAVVCVGGLLLDPRLLGGQPIWAKPFKFSVSIALYGATLIWMISLVTAPAARRWAERFGAVVAVTAGIEMVAIVGQVVRGRTSHFDVATPFDATVWAVMAISIMTLWVATGAIAIVLLRERSLPLATAWGVRLGLAVTLLGMGAAFLMTGPTGAQIAAAPTNGLPTVGAHAVGVPDGGPGLPLLGWSTTGGDLRIGHFVGLHALQGLPLLALGLALLAARVPALRAERVRAHLVAIGGAAWAVLVVGLLWQALRAQPLIAPDGVTLTALAALVVVTLASVVVVVRRGSAAAVRTAPAPERVR